MEGYSHLMSFRGLSVFGGGAKDGPFGSFLGIMKAAPLLVLRDSTRSRLASFEKRGFSNSIMELYRKEVMKRTSCCY